MSTIANGLQIIAPQAVAVVNEQITISATPETPVIVAAIGSCDGGQPGVFVPFSSFAEAQATLRSGTLVDVLQRLYGPSVDTPGAHRVLAYRVNTGVQATGTLKDAGAATAISLVSKDYGLHTNQVRVKVENGTTGYKASIQGYDGTAVLTRDNIARDMISVQYIGAGSAATIAVSSTTLTTVVTGGAAGESVTLTLATYPTIRALADALIGTGGFSVTVKADSRLASSALDVLSATDCKTAIRTLTANQQALIDWLNDGPYVTATRVTGNAIAAMTAFASLTGGSNGGAVTTTDYQNALTALQAETAHIVIVGSEDSAVHAMVDAHCQLMSQPGNSRERVAVVGGAAGETVDQALVRAKALGSFRTVLAYPGVRDYDALGSSVIYSPMYTAAAIAGILAGVNPGTPATRRGVSCIGPAQRLSRTDIDRCLLGGVAPIEPAPAGARVVQSLTTYTANSASVNNLLKREVSARIAADQLISRVRGALDDQLIGQPNGPIAKARALSVAETALLQAVTDGLIVGDQQNPAFQDLQATVNGETITVSFRASVVVPGNYVILNASLGTYSG